MYTTNQSILANEFRTVRSVISAFRDFAADRTGRPSDDTSWSPRLIYFYLNQYRNRMVYEKQINKGLKTPSKTVYETLPCIGLEEVDQAECPCAPASGQKFMRSIHPIPKMMGDEYKTVSNLTGSINFNYVEWYDFPDKLKGRLKGTRKGDYFTFRTINNGIRLYIYVNNDIHIEGVSMTALFEDPIEVAEFPSCDEPEQPLCSPLDREFVIDRELQSKVFELTLQSLANMKSVAVGADVINNDVDDTSVNTTQSG